MWPPACSHAHHWLLRQRPSTWCAEVAAPQRKPAGKARRPAMGRHSLAALLRPCHDGHWPRPVRLPPMEWQPPVGPGSGRLVETVEAPPRIVHRPNVAAAAIDDESAADPTVEVGRVRGREARRVEAQERGQKGEPPAGGVQVALVEPGVPPLVEVD